VTNHIRVDITNIQVSGNVLTARTLMRADSIAASGFIRIVVQETITFSGDKISREVRDLDLSDELTAHYAALVELRERPASSSIGPPATGDGGLLNLKD